MTRYMRNSDAFTWSMESDPRLRSTVVSVILLDRPPDWPALRARFERLSAILPMFGCCVVNSPPPAPPRWEPDPDFDLDYHLRRLTLPAPGAFADVLELARLAAMEDFDRARALWVVTVAEGLPDGGAAVICKFHHALTDGVGGVQIGMLLFDLTAAGRMSELPRATRPPGRPRPLGGYLDTARYTAGLIGSAATSAARAAPGFAVAALTRPVRTLTSTAELAASVYRTIRPVTRTGSPLMKQRSRIRRLGVLDVPMPALRAAAHRCGGSLNDAFVAGVAGGLRLYHEKHGMPVGDLHLTMPVSLRAAGDEIGGNRITLMRFDVPVGMADPAQRIAAIGACTGRVRQEKSLRYTQLIAGALNLMPRWYIGSILRNVDFLASDVPGIPVPVFLAGAAVLRQYAFGPTIGAAVNVTLLTYLDTCALGIDVDTGAIADAEEFFGCLAAGFDEVLVL